MKGKYTRYFAPLLVLGFPIMVGQLGTIVMGFADTLMVGRHGTMELAAAGFVNNILGLVLISGMGFSYGLTPVISALMGEGKKESVAGKLKNSLMVNGLMSLLMMGLMVLLIYNLHALGLPGELLPLMKPYMWVLTASILPQMAFYALKQFAEGIQDSKTPMWVMLACNCFNVLGNWWLIFGVKPFPEMGLLGAGISTLVSRILMCVAMVGVFRFSERYRGWYASYKSSSLDLPSMKELSRLGFPVMVQMGMETASFSLSALYVGWLGTTELAAHQVMITLSQFCFMLYYGMATAVAIKVGFYRGAGRYEETRRVAFAGLLLMFMLTLCTAFPIFLLRHQVGWWFTDDAAVASLVSVVIIPLCIYQIGDALQCNYANALRGMADVRPLILYAFIAYFVISLPLGYLFGIKMQYGLVGIWMAFPFGLTSAGLMYLARFKYHHKMLST